MRIVGKPDFHGHVLRRLVPRKIKLDIVHGHADVIELNRVVDGRDAQALVSGFLQVRLLIHRDGLPGETAPMVEVEHHDLKRRSAQQNNAGDLREVPQPRMMSGNELAK